MSNRIIENRDSLTSSDSRVAVNSTVINAGDFVTLVGNTATVATTTSPIVGVSHQTTTFSSTNETVEKKILSYIVADEKLIVRVAISGGTITSEDVGKFYSLGDDGHTVDGTTASTTTGTLQMVKYVSATSADFKVVNK